MWLNKLTLKDTTVSYCFILFLCGGPCHLQTVFWDLIFLWEQLVYSVYKMFLIDLINIVNIKILSSNFFSKTT